MLLDIWRIGRYIGAVQNRSSKPKSPKRPRDLNELAAAIVAEATQEEPETASEVVVIAVAAEADPATDDGKNPAAVALGRLGGLKGGKARAAKLTAKERREIARRAAAARWGSRPKVEHGNSAAVE